MSRWSLTLQQEQIWSDFIFHSAAWAPSNLSRRWASFLQEHWLQRQQDHRQSTDNSVIFQRQTFNSRQFCHFPSECQTFNSIPLNCHSWPAFRSWALLSTYPWGSPAIVVTLLSSSYPQHAIPKGVWPLRGFPSLWAYIALPMLSARFHTEQSTQPVPCSCM